MEINLNDDEIRLVKHLLYLCKTIVVDIDKNHNDIKIADSIINKIETKELELVI